MFYFKCIKLEVLNGECISSKYMTLTYVFYILDYCIVRFAHSVSYIAMAHRIWYNSGVFERQKPGAFDWMAFNIIIVLSGEDVV